MQQNNKKIGKLIKKIQKIKSLGWKEDVYYICKDAFANDRRVVHPLVHEDKFFCPYCGMEVVDIFRHFNTSVQKTI